MDTQPFADAPDHAIAELARKQHGVVARRQLISAGLSPTEVGRRLRRGRLHQFHRGVYLVGHAVPTAHGPEMAALLACGKAAVLSHRSAASVWELLPYPAAAPARVTIPPERHIARPGIVAHRRRLEPRDIRRRFGLPLTSPPRTILDLAAELGGDGSTRWSDIERVVAEAGYRRLASEAELREQLERNPGWPGTSALRAVLDLPGGPRRTRSPAEKSMLSLLRRNGIAGYETNARIHGYEVDFVWRDLRFAVEIDGFDAHSGRVAFERDRLKAATLNAHGVRVMPVTGRQVLDDPQGVIARLRRALEHAGARQTEN
jgi:very-short-patch-repair endonuclease